MTENEGFSSTFGHFYCYFGNFTATFTKTGEF